MGEMQIEHLSSEPAVVDGVQVRNEPLRWVRVRVDDLDVVMSPETYEFMCDLKPERQMRFLRNAASQR